MTQPKNDLTAEQVRSVLNYDPESGRFTWRCGARAGQSAGAVNDRGYVVIELNGRAYRAHRLAWLHFYGYWPAALVDHEDQNRQNNRIDNLRDATLQQNNANRRRDQVSKSGFKGVRWHSRDQRWQAAIKFGRKRRYLGQFTSPEEAYVTYCVVAQRLFGEFARFA